MNIQVQSSRIQPHPGLPKPILKRSAPNFVFHDDTTEKIGSSRNAFLLQEPIQAPALKEDQDMMMLTDPSNLYILPTVPSLLEEQPALDLILSSDDASNVSSDISLATGDEWEEEVWDLRDYPSAVADYRKYSWTIEVYDREHLAGDTVWFRVSYNGKAGYREFENAEILAFIDMAIEMNSCFSFYVKAKFDDGDDEPVSLFESDLIIPALKAILIHAESKNGVVIPCESELLRKKQALKPEKRRRNAFYRGSSGCRLAVQIVSLYLESF